MSVLVSPAGWMGNLKSARTLRFMFSTHAATGAPTALAGTPAISVYKDADDTQVTTGVTLSVDADGVTGLNRVLIDLSDSFYAAGSDFHVVITTGTVSAVSVVGTVAATFSILNRFAEADVTRWGGQSATFITDTSTAYPVVSVGSLYDAGNDATYDVDAGGVRATLADASLTTAKLGTFVLAKTTNISGFNDIAATAIVSAGAITTSSGAVSTVTNLTNAPTIGDFTTTMKTSIGTAVAASAVASVTGSVGSVSGIVSAQLADGVTHGGSDASLAMGTVAFLGNFTVTGAFAATNVSNDIRGVTATIAGTTGTLDALQTALNSTHGAGSWATATSVTVSDKTGFSLVSAYDPAKTAAQAGDAMAITVGTGNALVAAVAAQVTTDHGSGSYLTATSVTVSDKTGFSLAAAGLDLITATRPAGVSTIFPQMIVSMFYREFGKTIYDSNNETIKTYGANGTTVITTQTATSSGGINTQGEAS